ncbi:hypothetical protein PNEG_00919 [Pneumocystis murina B123]|uniref:2,5-diamino-6-ribosylamino-4(3H)-pyrimidinone 5'-phosphate reductase n=1 Tax=Pneumocystis murina (strain B123) TaxID=1069680 RepID=M7NUL3_PNEMU|nr:hypothetical protein PNEG_00919 [Pneumocystis murina B123]EMR10771.1 hypothetical protein PNEG_00919 [Pneumocystis murina B123]
MDQLNKMEQLNNEIKEFLSPYLPSLKSNDMNIKRPFLTLTYAQSLNSKIGTKTTSPLILSCLESKTLTHKLRVEHDAILVGAGTVESDNPKLNARISGSSELHYPLELQPIPIILDPNFQLKLTHESKIIHVAKNKQGRPPIILVSEDVNCNSCCKSLNALESVGGEIVRVKTNVNGMFEWHDILCTLLKLKIESVLVEGGASVISSLLKEWKLIDSIIITISPIFVGDNDGIGIEGINSLCKVRNISWKTFGKDIVFAGNLSL